MEAELLRIKTILVLVITLGSVWATPPFDWPTYNHDSVHSGQIPVVPMGQCSLAWTYDPGLSSFNGNEHGSPVATESTVVYATTDGRLRAINARTGTERWNVLVGSAYNGQNPGTPIIFADSVVACAFGASTPCTVYCRRMSNGSLKWRRGLTAPGIESDPIIINYGGIPTLYLGLANGWVIGINMLNGNQRYLWQVSAGSIRGAIATDGTGLYVVSSDSGLSKWTPTGTRVWRMAPNPTFNYNCRSGATYCNGRVFFGTDSGGGRLFAVRASDGGRAWTSGQIGSIAFGIPSSFDTTHVFVGTQTGYVYAFRQSPPLTTYWSRQVVMNGAARQISGGLAVTTLDSGRVYVSAGYPRGGVFVLDRTTGVIRETIPHPEDTVGMLNSVARVRNWLYVKDFRERVLAYRSDDFVPDRDVGCSFIVAPKGGVDSGTVVTPSCSVYNYGNTTESYAVRMRIGTTYNNQVNVLAHLPGTTVYVTFPNWVASVPGTYAVNCSTQLATDMELTNDALFDSVTVYPLHDVGCTRLIVPSGPLDSGTTVTPACSIFNYGVSDPTYWVRMKVGSDYNRTAMVYGHVSKTYVYVTFPQWTATGRGPYSASCSTELSMDGSPANDKAVSVGTMRVHDVGAARIVAPSGWVDSGTTITPACSVYNYGTEVETYEVRMKIGSGGYNTTRTASDHAPGTYLYLTFPNWTATQRGTFPTSCSTELATDMRPSNDRVASSVLVRLLDVGVAQITAPGMLVDSGRPVSPVVQLRNYGNVEANLSVRLSIIDTNGLLVYDTTESDIVLPGGQSSSLTFARSWSPSVLGRYWLTSYTMLSGDANPANDTVRDSCTVVPPQPAGWSEQKSMPAAPSNSQVKDGGWLAFDAGTDLIYAAKGNKQTDFYSYSPGLDTWLVLAPIPLGTEGKKPGKGAAGCADGRGRTYALKGNNTVGYYRYDATSDSWQQLVDVPLGTTNKRVKGGGGLVYAEREGRGWIFMLKGQKNEFFGWQVPAEGEPDTTTWHSLADAPGVSKWDKGSWLVWDHSGRIYAHKAKYHEFYTYDIASDSWSERLTGMPLLSRSGKTKKSKDGGSAIWFGNRIFALKGGNTTEFWTYAPVSDSWDELDPVPELGSSGKKKKVKAGGAMATDGNDIYALKGNKTLEFWQYHPSALLNVTSTVSSERTVQLAAQTIRTGLSELRLFPNPLTGHSQLKLAASPGKHAGRLVRVTIHDATGRVVHFGLHSPRTEISLRLPAGVYLVRLDDDQNKIKQKLVIQH